MDLIINERPMCTAHVSLQSVRQKLKEGKEPDIAIFESTTFDTGSKIRLTDAMKLLLHNIDWMAVLRATKNTKENMHVQYHLTKYQDKMVYTPGAVSWDMTRINLTEHKLRGQGIMLLHNPVNSAEFAIREFINSDTFRFGMPGMKWDWLIEDQDITNGGINENDDNNR